MKKSETIKIDGRLKMTYWISIFAIVLPLVMSSCAAHIKVISENKNVNGTKTAVGTKENLDLLIVADNRFRSGKYAEATKLYTDLATRSAKEGDDVVMVQALAMTARGHLKGSNTTKGLAWLQRAEKLATKDEPLGWSRYVGVRGRFEWKSGDKAKATATFYQMYDYCIQHDLFSRAIDAAHMVAITGTPEEQIEWAYKGIKAAKLGNEEGWLGPLWNNLGATYWEKAENSDSAQAFNLKALECYLNAREYHWKMGSEKSKLIADWAVGSAYRRVGDYEKAGGWLRAVMAWSERLYALDSEPDTGEWIGWASYDLGLMSQEQGNHSDALTLLRTARDYLGKADMPKWDKKTWDWLGGKISNIENNLNMQNP